MYLQHLDREIRFTLLIFDHFMFDHLKEQCGVDGDDPVVTIRRNEEEDWSFGHGRAQVLPGDL